MQTCGRSSIRDSESLVAAAFREMGQTSAQASIFLHALQRTAPTAQQETQLAIKLQRTLNTTNKTLVVHAVHHMTKAAVGGSKCLMEAS